jgi:hypothetical protein
MLCKLTVCVTPWILSEPGAVATGSFGQPVFQLLTMETAVEKLAAICILVISLSHIIQPGAWAEFFIMLREKGKVGSLLCGLLHFPLGVIIVAFHNVWHGLPIVVTIMGWGLLLKSVLYLIYPKHGMRMLARVSVERSWEFVVAGVMGVVISGLIFFSLLR